MTDTLVRCPEYEEVKSIFESVTVRGDTPFPIGTRCESFTFYRVEDLNDSDLDKCATYVAFMLKDMLSPQHPELFLKLPGGYSFFGERLAAIYNSLWSPINEIPFEQFLEGKFTNGYAEKYVGKRVVLITDVITTARSSLETHTKATIRGMQVVCWATLIDRTLGPGPVSVISAIIGDPVRLLNTAGY